MNNPFEKADDLSKERFLLEKCETMEYKLNELSRDN
jgi:hypothetical protein